MKNSKPIAWLFILLAVSVITSAQTQRQSYRNSDRQIGTLIQRLEESTRNFHNSLNLALVQGRIDETSDQNNISVFEPRFEESIGKLKDQLARRLAVAANVADVLQKATPINAFVNNNRLSLQAQNDWTSVRTQLNALAKAYRISWQWNPQAQRPNDPDQSSRLSDSALDQLIRRVETGGDTFRVSLTDAFDGTRYDQTTNESKANDALRAFKFATDQLRNQFDTKQPASENVTRLLARAVPIDTYMRNNRLTNRVQNDWSTLRSDLTTLASAYNLSPNWQDSTNSQVGDNSNGRLTGTFRLDSSRSDNPRDVAERATRNLSANERQSVSDRVLARLESPEMLAIERIGSTITIASTRAPRSIFEADGIERQEQLANGRSNRVTATLRGDQLSVSSRGYTENDFNVAFEPIENGRALRVRREIYSERLSQPVVVNSIYDRSADVAQWNLYDGSGPYLKSTGADEFIVRDGEVILAVLSTDVSTKQAKEGDRFAMTVRQPNQYEGAVIEGSVGSVNQGGRLTGRSALSLNFQTIRLGNGQTYRFAGTLENVRTPNGDAVKVDNEGSAQGDNQTTQTVQRTAIGTAIGAIIGAIAGGGKGAAIGGIIGAAGGAGSIYVQGKDSLELPSGTELTIRTGGPR